ncbi:hypothetical protein D9M68_992400 [compost metagenome]
MAFNQSSFDQPRKLIDCRTLSQACEGFYFAAWQAPLSDERDNRRGTFGTKALFPNFFVEMKSAGYVLPKLGGIHGRRHVIDLIVTNLQHELDELKIATLRQLAASVEVTFS